MSKETETTNEIVGHVHSWELVTAVDGPGTRMTVFLSGCPLRCLYCHNPDTRYMKWGVETPLSEITARLKKYRNIFSTTGGGLTISGGEPMMQPKFFQELVKTAKNMNIHVTVDTTGYLAKLYKDEFLETIDLFLLDIKSGLDIVHQETTKRSLQPTLDFAYRLKKLNKKTWIRFVLVPGLTDSIENVNAVIEHVKSFGDIVERVEILPFHQMGKSKWDEVGLNYELNETDSPSLELIERVKNQFINEGIMVKVG